MPGVAVRVLVPGRALGEVVRVEPLSFWGGFDAATGRVVEPSHPQFDRELAGRVVVMPVGRGSSSSSSVLAEAIRAGTAPAAFVVLELDPILAVGAMVAEELYGRACPVVIAPAEVWETLADGRWVEVVAEETGGCVTRR
ncbi:MAG: DUF126 domain-containing protein [Gemmataceae bacterium]|nr:DUF126 domain-containing protein [Gemmataceae bacterium]